MINTVPSSTLGPRALTEALNGFYNQRRWSVFVWGKPGIGKSDIVRQVAAKNGGQVWDCRLSQMDATDIKGIPFVRDGITYWASPNIFPSDPKAEGILFLDELPSAPTLVQAGAYQVSLERVVGERKLPDGVLVVAAGNRAMDRGVTNRMPKPLQNRFIHYHLEVSNQNWEKWALDNGLSVEVIFFLRFRPELLMAFDPKSEEMSFPTPRSWEMVSDIVKMKLSPAIEFATIAGAVGEAAATELYGFLDLARKAPNLDAIIADPKGMDVPNDTAVSYAVASGLVRKANDNNFDAIGVYAERMDKEFGALLMTGCISQHKELSTHPAWTRYCINNTEFV